MRRSASRPRAAGRAAPQKTELDDAYVLVSQQKVSNIQNILPALNLLNLSPVLCFRGPVMCVSRICM